MDFLISCWPLVQFWLLLLGSWCLYAHRNMIISMFRLTSKAMIEEIYIVGTTYGVGFFISLLFIGLQGVFCYDTVFRWYNKDTLSNCFSKFHWFYVPFVIELYYNPCYVFCNIVGWSNHRSKRIWLTRRLKIQWLRWIHISRWFPASLETSYKRK